MANLVLLEATDGQICFVLSYKVVGYFYISPVPYLEKERNIPDF